MAASDAPAASRRPSTGCLGAFVGLAVLVCISILIDSGLSSLPESGWAVAAVGAVVVVGGTVTAASLIRHNRRQANQDIEQRGWQRKGSIPMRQAPIVERGRFVSMDAAKAELACRQVTLNVLSMNGLDPCWSESGEAGFTRESVEAEAAYRRTASRGRILVRTVGRALAKGV